MRHLLIAFVFVCTAALGQNTVILNIEHRLASEEFNLFQDAEINGYTFQLDRLEYYISDISITHDGGQLTEIEDTWLLVDAGTSDSFDLGNHMINSVESISFYIGVGPDVNNGDPASWQNSHPLAPQNPSMHWGWASGYKFVTIEGLAGPSSSTNVFEIHALGNENYFETVLPVNAEVVSGIVQIQISADYTKALAGIDVSGGVINHSLTGISIDLLENFNQEVFSTNIVDDVDEFDFSGTWSLRPNPTSGNAYLEYSIPQNGALSVRITDMKGSIAHVQTLSDDAGILALPNLEKGVYMIELLDSERSLRMERLMVH